MAADRRKESAAVKTSIQRGKNTCLPVFQGCLQSEAVRLGAFIARRTGKAVESRVCVYAPHDTHFLHFTLKRWRMDSEGLSMFSGLNTNF